MGQVLHRATLHRAAERSREGRAGAGDQSPCAGTRPDMPSRGHCSPSGSWGRRNGSGAGVHTHGVARVIAGEAGGRRLAVPDGRDTRPTSDRAREGLFATIVSLTGSLDGACVLDLYAGSGAVGLEALSRGAEHVLLVEYGA